MKDWLRQLGVRVPVWNAGMGLGIAGPPLADAVARAGGFGVLGLGAYPPEGVRAQIRAMRALGDRAFGVNLILPMTVGGEVEVCLEERVPLLILFWGDVAPYAKEATARGVTLFAQVGSAAEAVEAVEAGAAGVIVQGVEAGGHVRATAPLAETLPTTRAALGRSVPVVAAGGVADGHDVAHALSRGADAVSIGTRFVATPEAAVCAEYRARIVGAAPGDTVLSELFDRGWPEAPHRVLRNRAVEVWEGAGRPRTGERPEEGKVVGSVERGGERQELPRYTVVPAVEGFEGDIEETPLYAGLSSEHVESVVPAASVVARFAEELRAATA